MRHIRTKESTIQTAIEEYLKILENKKKLIYIKNNSGAMKVGDRYIRFGRPGSPDFIVFIQGGGTLHLEVKNETGRQNKAQRGYQSLIEGLSHRYYIARSVEDVQRILKRERLEGNNGSLG